MLRIIYRDTDDTVREQVYQMDSRLVHHENWLDQLSRSAFHVEADGVELAWIAHHFKNIPMTTGDKVRWCKPWVKMIISNLKLLDFWARD